MDKFRIFSFSDEEISYEPKQRQTGSTEKPLQGKYSTPIYISI